MEMLNLIVMHGRLTSDPELKNLSSGKTVCNFDLACNRSWKNSNGDKQEAVCFVRAVAWGKLGELVAKHKKKGEAVIITGRLDQQRWEKDGNKHSRHEIVCESVEFLGKKDDGNGEGRQRRRRQQRGGLYYAITDCRGAY